jgi:cation diffusion facilitator CzcD-associated flavoprotein CzcO
MGVRAPSRRQLSLGDISVAVIGAGPGGICMGVGLRRAGVSRFTIYEQSRDIGGTWFDSAYPGAAVDTAQPLYGFSFAPFDFTKTHVGQPELLAYLHSVAERFHIRDNVRLNCKVDRVEWDNRACQYTVYTADGSAERYEVVVSAVGLLNNPRYPSWPGLADFRGQKFHSSRWNPDVEVSDKVVAVVGTGSTAAQIVPGIAPVVKQLYVYQRQPGWVLPKGERIYDAHERAELLHPVRRRVRRYKQIWDSEKRLRSARAERSALNQKAYEGCLKYIAKVFSERPDLAKLVTPDYPYGGKRPIVDSNYYPALLRDNVTTYEVSGRGGRTLRAVWNGGPFAFLGLMVPGFPNFYLLYGPNTNGGPIMFFHERQVEFVLGNLRRMARTGVRGLEVRAGLTRTFNRVLDRRLQRMVTTRYKVHGYAFSETGREVISWGEGLTAYWLATHGSRPFACHPVTPAD